MARLLLVVRRSPACLRVARAAPSIDRVRDTSGVSAHPAGRSYIDAYERVQRATDHAFLEQAVEASGARVIYSSGPRVAPLFLTIEHPDGSREGVVAYAFHANRRETRNRPADEHRGQIRYGDVNDPAWRALRHAVAFDPTGADVTLVLVVEPEAGLIVALDPLLYDPLPIGSSIFWKDGDVSAAQASGWHAWERDNLTGARKDDARQAFGIETLLAIVPGRLCDLIAFERRAQALRLDPALRLAAATEVQGAGAGPASVHELEIQYELPASDILEIIKGRGRLAMAVRGGVAEYHLGRLLDAHPMVAEALVGHQEGPPDYWVTLRDGRKVTIECKNASPKTYADGTPKAEVQKTRASQSDPMSRLYEPSAFDLIAVCMYGPTGRWTFKLRRSSDLRPHDEHPGRIAPLQRITADWADDLAEVL